MFRWPFFVLLCLVPLLGGCGGGQVTLGSLLEQLFIGLILGSVYALIALGYTLVYGVIKLINFAHGDIYMLGAYGGYFLLRLTIRWLHYEYGVHLIICFIISTIISAAVCALLAVLMERFAYRPLRGSSRIAALITAVGVSFLLENSGIIAFGPNPKSYEPKTLEVYQVELADEASFSKSQQHEVIDHTMLAIPPLAEGQLRYARARVVTPAGTSAWSPVLELDGSQPGGFSDAEPEASTEEGPTPLPSIGYSTREEGGRCVCELTWPAALGTDIALNPVFSDSTGKQLAIELPVVNAAGDNVRVPVFNLVIVATTLLLLWLLNVLINRSMFGIGMRALSFDMDAAKLMGVNTNRVIALTFAIGGACAAVAGNMVGIYNQSIDPLMGILPGLKAFVAAVVGGIGSIPGAAAGGLIMGLSEGFVKANISQAWSSLADALAFAILIAVLLFKPTGLLGSSVREKV